MRLATTLLVALTLLTPATRLVEASDTQTRLSVSDLYSHTFDVDFPADQKLRLDLRSGENRIVGTDAHKISIHVSGKKAENARDLTANFKHIGNHADLHIYGGGTNNEVEIT